MLCIASFVEAMNIHEEVRARLEVLQPTVVLLEEAKPKFHLLTHPGDWEYLGLRDTFIAEAEKDWIISVDTESFLKPPAGGTKEDSYKYMVFGNASGRVVVLDLPMLRKNTGAGARVRDVIPKDLIELLNVGSLVNVGSDLEADIAKDFQPMGIRLAAPVVDTRHIMLDGQVKRLLNYSGEKNGLGIVSELIFDWNYKPIKDYKAFKRSGLVLDEYRSYKLYNWDGRWPLHEKAYLRNDALMPIALALKHLEICPSHRLKGSFGRRLYYSLEKYFIKIPSPPTPATSTESTSPPPSTSAAHLAVGLASPGNFVGQPSAVSAAAVVGLASTDNFVGQPSAVVAATASAESLASPSTSAAATLSQPPERTRPHYKSRKPSFGHKSLEARPHFECCYFCGSVSHQKLSRDCSEIVCPKYNDQAKCTYKHCNRKSEHLIKTCYVLHQLCSNCGNRGHESRMCGGKFDFQGQQRLWNDFEAVADLGIYTRLRYVEPSWGFFTTHRSVPVEKLPKYVDYRKLCTMSYSKAQRVYGKAAKTCRLEAAKE